MSEASECPVCLEAIQPRTEPHGATSYLFPLRPPRLHACNARLLERNDLRCPLCRKPREGVSEGAAARAAEFRALVDRSEDRENDVLGEIESFVGNGGAGPGGGGVGVGGIVQRDGRRFEVLFFVNQAEGDPFESIDSAAERLRSASLRPAAGRCGSGCRRRRRRRSGRRRRRRRRRRRLARAPARARASERSAEPALQRPFTIDPRDVNLNELVSHLLQPTPLSSFLGARRRVVPRARRRRRNRRRRDRACV